MFIKLTMIIILLSLSVFSNSNFGAIATSSDNDSNIKTAYEISKYFSKYEAKLNILPTKGSIENLDLLSQTHGKNSSKWAIVQKDTLEYYKFLHFKNEREDLDKIVKPLLPLYNHPIYLLKKNDKHLHFKKGAVFHVAISSRKSGAHITANIIENAYNLNFIYHYIDFDTAVKKIKENKIDIIIDIQSYSNKKYKKLQGISLVELPKNKIMDKRYIPVSFSNKHYEWITKEIKGYATPVLLVTNLISKKNQEVVQIFLNMILSNYQSLIKNAHHNWKEVYQKKLFELKNLHPIAYKTFYQ